MLWIEYSARALFDAHGQITGYVSVHRDITERKHTAQRLTYQANLLEMATDAIIASDTEGRATFWNAGAERVYGLGRDEVLGKTWDQLFPQAPEEQARRGSEVRRLAALERDTVHGELPVTLSDGRTIWIEYSLRPLFDPDGQITGHVTVHRDVTERRLAAQRMEEQAFLLANVSDAVIGLDLESRITYWSPSAERVLGYTPQEAWAGAVANCSGQPTPT